MSADFEQIGKNLPAKDLAESAPIRAKSAVDVFR